MRLRARLFGGSCAILDVCSRSCPFDLRRAGIDSYDASEVLSKSDCCLAIAGPTIDRQFMPGSDARKVFEKRFGIVWAANGVERRPLGKVILERHSRPVPGRAKLSATPGSNCG